MNDSFFAYLALLSSFFAQRQRNRRKPAVSGQSVTTFSNTFSIAHVKHLFVREIFSRNDQYLSFSYRWCTIWQDQVGGLGKVRQGWGVVGRLSLHTYKCPISAPYIADNNKKYVDTSRDGMLVYSRDNLRIKFASSIYSTVQREVL